MNFKQLVGSLVLLCFVVNAHAQYQKPLLVLNPLAPRPAQIACDLFILDDYSEAFDRGEAFIFGVGELGAGGLGCLWAGLASLFFHYSSKDSTKKHLFSDLYQTAYMPSLLFLDARLLVGGSCTMYNACVPSYRQIVMQPEHRQILGVLELAIATIMGICTMVEVKNLPDRNKFELAALTPGFWGLALCGAYDLYGASHVSDGITIARF